ncbi:hypothetical protein [Helicobacter salomonis]|uniref:hypothetical protein n=1 Tax=Helicobacter salomonis TaxID=56878 RepID=UPI000CF15CC9|nr:hypothetical protein [Helicobacter salomonis]
MVQRVKNVCYLCKVNFKLDEQDKTLAMLPSGAEVLSVNLQIVEPLAGATLDIGLKDEPDYFLSSVDGSNKTYEQSSALLSSPSNQTINATITGADPNKDSLATLRVLYFAPSEISIEC